LNSTWDGNKETVRGTAKYGHDPEFGPVLMITVGDSYDTFDFLLLPDQFNGEIAVGIGSCDFRIGLDIVDRDRGR
jgi:hypothetical protein